MPDAACENKKSSDTLFGALIDDMAKHSLAGLYTDAYKDCGVDKAAANQPGQAKELQNNDIVDIPPIKTGGSASEGIKGPTSPDKQSNQPGEHLSIPTPYMSPVLLYFPRHQ